MARRKQLAIYNDSMKSINGRYRIPNTGNSLNRVKIVAYLYSSKVVVNR